MVLCVLALGKVCLHKDKIPDVAYLFSQEGEGAPSPVARNGHPQSPFQNSPASRRPSADGARLKVDRVRSRNVDLIPGLDYFGLATEIIGNQLGGSNLQHVHVNILAGLYHGQLGRVLESHAYIFHACCTLQKIIGGKLPYFKRVKVEGKMVSGKENPYIFAFWTCLQLESDIIAELPVQQSGILSLEEDMPPINLKVATEVSGFPLHILESYTAQLYLRRHLNTVHGILYSPKDVKSDDAKNSKSKNEKDPTYLATIEALQDMINIENGWAPNMKWNGETGERAKDILNARLRAKWYGAHVITFRPFILQILDFTAKTSHAGSDHAMALVPWSYVHAMDVPAISPNATSPADISPKMIDSARKGLLALIHSTSAFHDVVDPGTERLIVTNIWGTAHAQWGNLVTLLAAFNDPILKPELLDLVSTDELRLLLEKTIAFLKFNATTASALYSDARILIHMGRKLNLLPESAKTTPHGGLDSSSSSFHSVASVDAREVTMSAAYQN